MTVTFSRFGLTAIRSKGFYRTTVYHDPTVDGMREFLRPDGTSAAEGSYTLGETGRGLTRLSWTETPKRGGSALLPIEEDSEPRKCVGSLF